MARSLALLLLTICLAPSWVGAQVEPSLESMQAIAREKVKQQAPFIRGRVLKAVALFQEEDAQPQVLAAEHESLIELGIGVLPPLMEVMQTTKSRAILAQIGWVLVKLVAEKRATPAEVSGPVLELLDLPSPMRTAAALRILGYIGDESAREAIKLMATREEPEIRAAVIESLARLGDKDVRNHFESAMASPSKELRVATLYAIRLIGDPRDVSYILSAIEDSELDVVLAAISAIEGVPTNSKAMRALHDELDNVSDQRTRRAIEVIRTIGNKDASVRYLAVFVKNPQRNIELRELAAMAMFQMGSSEGMKTLASNLQQGIDRSPKDPRNHEALAEYYAKFGAWKEAAKAYTTALDLTKQAQRLNNLRDLTARYWALAGQFKLSASLLKKTPRGDDWSDLATDPAYAKMKEDRRYLKYFNP